MKKLLHTLSIIALLVSCTDDDGNQVTQSVITIEGDYELTSIVADVPVDFDADGNSSTEVFNETDCFDAGTLSLMPNKDLTTTVQDISFDSNDVLQCNSLNFTGTYSYASSTLTVNIDVSGGTVTESKDVTLTPTTLEFTLSQAEIDRYFPDLDGTPAGNITSMDLVYTKI